MLPIVKFWSKCQLRTPPYFHPDDREVLTRRRVLPQAELDFDRFVESPRFGDSKDDQFHLSLIPTPYLGDLERADIFILSLNPGFNPADYFAEYEVPEFRRRRAQNLRQRLRRLRFPNMGLDPAFSWHSRYWTEKLRDAAIVIAQRKYAGRYLSALEELSRRVAILELVPYHSSAFSDHWTIMELPSAKEALRFAQTELTSRAADDDATIVVTRQVEAWGIRGRNVIRYASGEARGASLSMASRGGRAILRRILTRE